MYFTHFTADNTCMHYRETISSSFSVNSVANTSESLEKQFLNISDGKNSKALLGGLDLAFLFAYTVGMFARYVIEYKM